MSTVQESSSQALFIFIDESGDLLVPPQGTNYFILAAVSTFAPTSSATSVQELKYQLLSEGWNIPFFHASDNLRIIKDRFFKLIVAIESITSFVYVLDKRDEALLFLERTELFLSSLIDLLDEVFAHHAGRFRKVVLVLDRTFPKRQFSPIIQGIKSYLKKLDLSYHLIIQSASQEPNSQISDYISWSTFQKFEKGKVIDFVNLRSEL